VRAGYEHEVFDQPPLPGRPHGPAAFTFPGDPKVLQNTGGAPPPLHSVFVQPDPPYELQYTAARAAGAVVMAAATGKQAQASSAAMPATMAREVVVIWCRPFADIDYPRRHDNAGSVT
jgi:hypothetical protein